MVVFNKRFLNIILYKNRVTIVLLVTEYCCSIVVKRLFFLLSVSAEHWQVYDVKVYNIISFSAKQLPSLVLESLQSSLYKRAPCYVSTDNLTLFSESIEISLFSFFFFFCYWILLFSKHFCVELFYFKLGLEME